MQQPTSSPVSVDADVVIRQLATELGLARADVAIVTARAHTAEQEAAHLRARVAELEGRERPSVFVFDPAAEAAELGPRQ